MSETMVEIAAKAVAKATGYDWFDEPALVGTYGEKVVEDRRNECRALARAAIEAMRPNLKLEALAELDDGAIDG